MTATLRNTHGIHALSTRGAPPPLVRAALLEDSLLARAAGAAPDRLAAPPPLVRAPLLEGVLPDILTRSGPAPGAPAATEAADTRSSSKRQISAGFQARQKSARAPS